ncbi:hypothetical protein Bca52824_000665 [Brassica carinata]|uniref:Uncharacterized protein n=1 Tax=Brassica carinata TaxID=52824 RepID=A0A8X8BBW9_BRACI|nr:hypothetical protein Bca52824_000665 [Brassica carinata]
MVHTGCKREFQFMLKSQSEICGGKSLGRTRRSKSLISHSTSTTDSKKPRRILCSGIKKMRLIAKDDEDVVMPDSVEKDEEKSDVVDGVDEGEGSFCESAHVMNTDHSREKVETV